MSRGVMIRGRYVAKNKPIILVVIGLIMAVVAGINLGIGVNVYCYGYNNDSWCDYRKRSYIISGSCFVVSSVCFLAGALSLHLKIKQALRVNEATMAQPNPVPTSAYPQQATYVYPSVGNTQHYSPPTTPYSPPVGFASYDQPAPPVGFASHDQPAPPVASYPADHHDQLPPPYTP